jgi:hypothetical protein
MGTIRCAHCGKYNEDVDYAESCECTDFTCEFCHKKNMIIMSFTALPAPEEKKKAL